MLLVVLLVGLLSSVSDQVQFMLGGYLAFERLLWLVPALAAIVLLQLVCVYFAWARTYWWLSRRLHYTLLLGANLAFVGWCWYWQLAPEMLTNLL